MKLKKNSSKLKELSKLNELQQNQITILNQIQQIDNYFLHTCQFVSESIFDGILNYLHHKGQVRLTSGQKGIYDSSKVTNLIDYSDEKVTPYEACADQSTNWIEFNFLTRKIDLSSYQIRSFPSSLTRRHPKIWEIRGSNDQINWVTLDRRVNCSALNGYCKTKHFTCQTPNHKHYQSIRFYQYETWDSSYPYNIILSRFELYCSIHKIE